MFKITLIALGNKMPNWVNEAVLDFSKRLKEYAQITLLEIPLFKRGKNNDLLRIMEKESCLINATIPASTFLVALNSTGKSFTSEALAKKLLAIQQVSPHLCLLLGGPEGFHQSVLKRCQEEWSLSKLTFPHPLARIVLLEALYRAFSINHNHPYHK